ncbi:MAG TPA: hypothetical protein VN154_07660 [Rhizomicrobium sp.]|nr:hypothetical protein [Rhizomicrobium sp.]
MADTTAPAPAPPPKPTIVRGVIETIDTTSIKIKTDAGGEVTAAITPMSRFAAVEARTLNQIKATDFVGITAVPGRNGHLRAEELHILPAAGGEGQYPWDHHPSNAHAIDMGSMTNGSVESLHKTEPGSMTNGTVGAVSGEGELTISYHGAEMQDGKCEGHAMPGKTGCVGTTIVDITPQTYIAAIVPAKLAEGKPGLAVFAGVVTDSAGRSILGSATFEKNGVKPEF